MLLKDQSLLTLLTWRKPLPLPQAMGLLGKSGVTHMSKRYEPQGSQHAC